MEPGLVGNLAMTSSGLFVIPNCPITKWYNYQVDDNSAMSSGPDIPAPAGCCCHSYKPVTQPPGLEASNGCEVMCSSPGYQGLGPEKLYMLSSIQDAGLCRPSNATQREWFTRHRREGWMLDGAKEGNSVPAPQGK